MWQAGRLFSIYMYVFILCISYTMGNIYPCYITSFMLPKAASLANCSFHFSVIFHLCDENSEPSVPLNSAMLIFLH